MKVLYTSRSEIGKGTLLRSQNYFLWNVNFDPIREIATVNCSCFRRRASVRLDMLCTPFLRLEADDGQQGRANE